MYQILIPTLLGFCDSSDLAKPFAQGGDWGLCQAREEDLNCKKQLGGPNG